MNRFFVFVFSMLLLVFDDNALAIIGYPHFDIKANAIFKIHPVSYLCIVVFVFLMLLGKMTVQSIRKNCKAEIWLINVCLLMLVYLQLTGKLNNVSFIIDALLTPALLSILLAHTPEANIARFKWIIYTTFTLNFAMALYEKVRKVHILSDYYKFADEFRSSALYGHPLNNAFIMSIVGILLYFHFDKLIYKISVLIFAMIAIFCFGARGAFIGVMGGAIIGLCFDVISKKSKQSLNTLIGIIITGVITFTVLLNTNLGDRLLQRSSLSNDDSAQERVRALDILHIMKPSELLIGVSDNESDLLIKHVGAERIENFFVVYVVRFGIVIAILTTVVLIIFVIKQIRIFDRSVVIPVLFTFLFVASINNSLSTKNRPISVLVLCCFALRKRKYKGYVINEELAAMLTPPPVTSDTTQN